MRPSEMLSRARNAFRIGDLQAAEGLLSKLTERHPAYEVSRLLLGSVYARSGRLQDAAREFQALLQLKPDHAEAHNNLAVVYRGMGQLDRALEEVDKALANAPDQAAILYNKGNILKQQGRLPQAATAFRRAVRKDQHMVLAYNNLGTTYEAIGDLDEAIRWYRRGLRLDPNHPSLCYNFAVAHERLGDLETARTHLLRALKARPNWPACMNELGVVESRLGAHKEAERRFRDILAMDPENAAAFTSLASLHEDRGDPQGAMQLYRTALEHDPSHFAATVGLVRLLEEDAKPVGALEELRKAGIHHPNNVELQFRIGRLLLSLERFDEAEIELSSILESAPDHAPAHQALGMLYQHQGKSEQAGYHFRRLQEIEPDSIEHFLDRALWHRDNRRYEESENELQRVLAREPNNPQARELLAEVVAASGHQRHGLQILTELSREHPDTDRYLVALARAKQNMGDTTGAIQDLDSVINLQGRRGSREDIQRLQESLDLYEQLISDYEQDIGDSWKQNLQRLERYMHSTPQTVEVDADSVLFDALDDDETPLIDVGGPEPAIAVPEEIEIMDVTEENEDLEPESEQPEPQPPVTVANPETAIHPLTDLLRGEQMYGDSRIVDEPELTTGSPRGYAPAGPASPGGAGAGWTEPAPTRSPQRPGSARSGGPTTTGRRPAAGGSGGGIPESRPAQFGSAAASGPTGQSFAPKAGPRQEPSSPRSAEEPGAGTPESGHAGAAPDGAAAQPPAPVIQLISSPTDHRRSAAPPQPPRAAPAGGGNAAAETPAPPHVPATAGAPSAMGATAPPSPTVILVSGTVPVPPHVAATDEDVSGDVDGPGGESGDAEEVVSPVDSGEEDDPVPAEPQSDSDGAESDVPSEGPSAAQDGVSPPETVSPEEGSLPASAAGEPPKVPTGSATVGARESAALLQYLEGLAEHLPDPSRSAFLASDHRLRIEALRSRLSGHGGLSRFCDVGAAAAEKSGARQVSSSDAYATLTFVRNLTKFHPDRGIGFALTGKLTKILAGLRSHSQHGRPTEPEES